MRFVLPGIALFLAGCVEIWHSDAEVWVDVLYPPDSAWGLSPVNVVVAGAIQDSGFAFRLFPLFSSEEPPEPEVHPVPLSLWVDGEKRMDFPDTALIHRVWLDLSEGWHTLQVRAGTTASRIRHVRVLAPEHFPLRFTPQGEWPSLPRQVLPGLTMDTVLTLSSVPVHVFYDLEQHQWVVEHPQETLRIRESLGLHLWTFPEGLYALVFHEDSTQAFWIHLQGIIRISPPAAYSPRFFMEGIQVCGRTSVLLHYRTGGYPRYLLRLVEGIHIQDTVLDDPSRTPWILVCKDGNLRVTTMSLTEYRKNFPSLFPSPPSFTLLHIEGGDSVFRHWADLWWKEEGRWYRLVLPEAPLMNITCNPGRERHLYPGTKQVSHLQCDVSAGLFGMNPRVIRYRNQNRDQAYVWTIQKGAAPDHRTFREEP